MADISTKPYLIRAIYEWCTDSGYRPHIAVVVDERTVVPREFVRSGEIVLNVSAHATNRLNITNDVIEFEARFGGVARSVSIPIDNVSAIYAQENGHGMAFEVPAALALVPAPGNSGLLADLDDEAAPERGDEDASQGLAPRHGDIDTGQAGPASARTGRGPKLAAVPSVSEGAKTPRRRRKDKAALPDESTTTKTSSTATPVDQPAPPASRAAPPAGPGVPPVDPAAAPASVPTAPARSDREHPAVRDSARRPDESFGKPSQPSVVGVPSSSDEDPPPKPPSGRPRLTRVK